MKTYVAANPASWLQIHEPMWGELTPSGAVKTVNIVVGYRIRVSPHETVYDSDYQTADGRWHPHSHAKRLTEAGRKQLHAEIAAGTLKEVR